MQAKNYCCERMESQLNWHSNWNCNQHSDAFDCPDVLIIWWAKFDEYGIPIRDGGRSISTIRFCPWCGEKLPDSKRERWFDELEALGYDNPGEQDIPKEYTTDVWYQDTK